MNWTLLVEEILADDNGVFDVSLFFGNKHRCICKFYGAVKLADGRGSTMQEAVEKCIANWKLEEAARSFARNPVVV